MAIWNERIRSKRQEKGITLAQIANKLGVTEATAQRYESGNIKSVPYEHMCAYGEILGCSPAYLMGWEDAEEIGNIFHRRSINSVKKLIKSEFGKEEAEHFELYIELNSSNQKKVDLYTKNLLTNQQMEYELNAAHERTDIELTDEMKKHDDDIMMNDDEWK